MKDNKKMAIYVITHKQVDLNLPEIYKILLVGSYNKKDITDYLRDDTGENISYKNPNYCELTGLYWMWKNSNDDIIGLCHYRRFLVSRYGKLLDYKKINKYLNKYDIILPTKIYRKETIMESYKDGSNQLQEDILKCKDAIYKFYPEYIQSFDKVMNGNGEYLCNMFICKKKLMDEYCEWLFSFFDKLEPNIDMEKHVGNQKRVYGYLSERLFNVWIEKKHLRIKEVNKWFTSNNKLQYTKCNLGLLKRKIKYNRKKQHR